MLLNKKIVEIYSLTSYIKHYSFLYNDSARCYPFVFEKNTTIESQKFLYSVLHKRSIKRVMGID